MRIIACITERVQIKQIVEHIGVPAQAPRIAPARRPLLWDDCAAPAGDGVEPEPEPDLDESAQAAPDHDVDQRINW